MGLLWGVERRLVEVSALGTGVVVARLVVEALCEAEREEGQPGRVEATKGLVAMGMGLVVGGVIGSVRMVVVGMVMEQAQAQVQGQASQGRV